MRDYVYDAGELVTAYNQARNRKEQIGILADICCCTRAEMRDYLADLGCDVPELHRETRGKRAIPFDRELARRMWEEGCTDREIAKATGAKEIRIYQWRQSQRMIYRNRGA